MRRAAGSSALLTLMALSLAPSVLRGETAAADIVFLDGAVYTLDAARRWASAVAVRDGKIVFVGADADAQKFIAASTQIVDLDGRMLLPSFQDSHAHASLVPNPANELNLDGLKDREAVFARIREFAAANPYKSWIVGGGWDEAAFLPSGRPTRQMLDALVSDRPVFLINNSRHQAWVNSVALEVAGITRETQDPKNGEIMREAGGGPGGNLQETAMELVASKIPLRTPAERAEDISVALQQMNAQGITAMVEAAADPATIAAYEALHDTDRLATRVRICQRFDQNDANDDAQIRRFIAARERIAQKNRNGLLDADCVKIVLDGGYGSRSVALLKPYAIPGLGTGKLFVEPARLNALVTRLDALGFQVHVHAIGDRTVRAALDAVQAAREANPERRRAHTFAHLSLVDVADASRFRQLNVMPNMTPVWSRPDPWQTVFAVEMFGRERADTAYRTRSLADDGAQLVWGSDWPVTGVATLAGIETAVTHRYPGGRDPNGIEDYVWNPDQRLSLDRALAAYTATSAALLGEGARRGSIEVGKDADLVVLGRNLFDTPPTEIHKVPVELTLRQGRVLWSSAPANTLPKL